MVVVDVDHPRIREAPSLAALERENFVGLHRRPGQWDRALAINQVLALRDWKIAFNVSEFIEVPLIVAATDFVSVMPLSMRGLLEKTGLVRLLPFPTSLPPLEIKMTWHAGRRRDPGHMWLRRMVRQEVRRFADGADAAPLGRRARVVRLVLGESAGSQALPVWITPRNFSKRGGTGIANSRPTSRRHGRCGGARGCSVLNRQGARRRRGWRAPLHRTTRLTDGRGTGA